MSTLSPDFFLWLTPTASCPLLPALTKGPKSPPCQSLCLCLPLDPHASSAQHAPWLIPQQPDFSGAPFLKGSTLRVVFQMCLRTATRCSSVAPLHPSLHFSSHRWFPNLVSLYLSSLPHGFVFLVSALALHPQQASCFLYHSPYQSLLHTAGRVSP